MKTQIRLNSVVSNGVGSGPESGAIDLIYYFLLQEFNQNAYSYISINQIGDDLNEIILKDGKKIYINIRYPAYSDFDNKSMPEKNGIRLDVIHTALLRIAEYEKKLDIEKLDAIRNKIIENNFSFDFLCKEFINKKNKDLLIRVIVHPEMNEFNYYALVVKGNEVKHRIPIYTGLTVTSYFNSFFKTGKWGEDDVFVLSGKANEVETRISINTGRIEHVNLTRYEKPPLFEMMRAKISKEDRDKASKDWEHSLPPGFAAMIREADN
jgi:hypothetical protein